MKKRGISIMGIIVFLGLTALIIWGLNYIITKDFVIVRTPVIAVSNSNTDISQTPTETQNASATSTSSQATSTATSTQTKTPATNKTPSSDSVSKPTTPTLSALTVTFTDKGFSPTSLTIKKGQTVTFVNNSSSKMWVAANPFPTSSEYPAFNEKTGIANGKSWNFTFDKTGTWFYHNHYSPAQGAKIVVNAK